MIQTKVLVTYFKGLKRQVEPSIITSPSGSDISSVSKNNRQVSPKPSNKMVLMLLNDILNS